MSRPFGIPIRRSLREPVGPTSGRVWTRIYTPSRASFESLKDSSYFNYYSVYSSFNSYLQMPHSSPLDNLRTSLILACYFACIASQDPSIRRLLFIPENQL